MKIADIIRSGIADGSSNDEILTAVRKAYPDAGTNAACVAYYRCKAKKQAGAAIDKAKTTKPSAAKKPVAAAAQSDRLVYGITAYKPFASQDGGGFSLTLHRNGIPVAVVHNGGFGGPNDYDWLDVKAPAVMGRMRRYDDSLYERKMTPKEREFNEFVIKLPKYEAFGASHHPTDDVYLSELINDTLLEREVTKLTKGKVAHITLDGKLYTTKLGAMSEAQVIERLKAKHKGIVVLNELSKADAVARLRVMQGD